jgi:hypothetical protein
MSDEDQEEQAFSRVLGAVRAAREAANHNGHVRGKGGTGTLVCPVCGGTRASGIECAHRFGCSVSTVSNIKHGKQWVHV